jgi:hypothetical protein
VESIQYIFGPNKKGCPWTDSPQFRPLQIIGGEQIPG